MSSRFKLAIFDIDCTLILTGGAGSKAFKMAIEELFPDSTSFIPKDYLPHGRTDLGIFADYIRFIKHREPQQNEIEFIKTKYLSLLPAEMKLSIKKYKVLTGVKSLIEFIISKKVLVGLGTGNLEEAAKIKLESSGLLSYFSFGGYGSDSSDRSKLLSIAIKRGATILGEKVKPSEAIFFGDTKRDISAVRKIGGYIVGVATGIETVEDLQEADLSVSNLEDIRIKELFN